MTEETTALVPVNVEDFSMDVRGVQQQITGLHDLMKSTMKEGNHFGVIPGTHKPSLFKPGAEIILVRSRLRPDVRDIKAIEMPDFISFTITLDLYHIPTGNLVGTGVGSCNSRETKFQRESNPWNLHNTFLKMAKKRALIDAVLNATAASEIFTQDVEDIDSPVIQAPAPAAPPPDADKVEQQRAEITSMLREIASDDPTAFSDELEMITEWTDKTGKVVKGKRDVKKLTDKQMGTVHHKVKAHYETWKEQNA